MRQEVSREARIARLQDIGCLACLQDGRVGVPSDMHHPLKGYRMGEDITVPLCAWHHRGVMPGNPDEVAKYWGPSLQLHRRAFRQCYGTDEQLLDFAESLLSHMYGGTSD